MSTRSAKATAVKTAAPPAAEPMPIQSFGKVVSPYWDDKPVAIVGGGPSLTGFDYEQLRGAHVLAVGRAILAIPWADAGFGLGEMPEQLDAVPMRVYWAVPDEERPPPSRNITFLHRLDGHVLSEDPGSVSGKTSGFGAVQVAIHKRAKRIVLFGFDYDGSNGGPHSGEGSAAYQRRRVRDIESWRTWAEHFRVFVQRLQETMVVNACPTSNIACFQKVHVEDGVRMLKG